MPDKDKPLRPKLIVLGAEGGEKKGGPVVPGLPEEAEPQLTVPLSGLPAEQPDAGLPAGPKVVVRPMLSPASVDLTGDEETAQEEDGLPEVVEMGPAPEEDGIVDIVGTIGVAEEVIAELDEVAQREEQARIAEAERAEAQAQARAEEEERVRAEAQAQAARQQQGYPMSPAGQPYPGQAYGATGEGRHGGVGMQVKSPSGIPGWAIYMIGFLSGALILLILFMATPMGEGLIGKSLMEKGWRKMENPGKNRRFSPAVQSPFLPQPGSVE